MARFLGWYTRNLIRSCNRPGDTTSTRSTVCHTTGETNNPQDTRTDIQAVKRHTHRRITIQRWKAHTRNKTPRNAPRTHGTAQRATTHNRKPGPGGETAHPSTYHDTTMEGGEYRQDVKNGHPSRPPMHKRRPPSTLLRVSRATVENAVQWPTSRTTLAHVTHAHTPRGVTRRVTFNRRSNPHRPSRVRLV